MLKLEIKFDDAKIQADRKYAPETIYAAVDRAFAKYHFPKQTLPDGTVCYCGTAWPGTMAPLAGSSLH